MTSHQQTNSVPDSTQATRSQRWLGLVVFTGIAGGVLLLNGLQRLGFDFGRLFWPCGFRVRTGYPCITCGMTRAVMAFSRGELGEAFRLQPAAGLLGLVFVAVALIGLYIALSGHCPRFVKRFFTEFRWKWFLGLLGLILVAGWVVTWAQAYRDWH